MGHSVLIPVGLSERTIGIIGFAFLPQDCTESVEYIHIVCGFMYWILVLKFV